MTKFNLFKTLFLVLILSASFKQTNGQLVRGGENSPAFKMVTERPLLVLYTGDELFDEVLENSFKKYWKVSEYKFIESKNLSKYNTNKEYNYFTIYSSGYVTTKTNVTGDETDINGFSLVVSAEDPKFIGVANLSAYIPFNNKIAAFYAEVMTPYDSVRMDYIICGLNSMYEAIGQYKIKGITTTSFGKILEEFSSYYAPQISHKTLLILDEMTQPQGSKNYQFIDPAVLKAYPYKYKIVSMEEFIQLSNSNSKDYCFLDYVDNDFKYIFIYDVATKKLMYGDMPVAKEHILSDKDIEAITKAIRN